MKILAIILILAGLGGISSGDILAGLLCLIIGVVLFRKKKKSINEKSKKIIQDKPNILIKSNKQKTTIELPKRDIDYSTIITKVKEYETNGSEFIVLDLETTGLSSEYDRIVEIGALKFSNNELVESFITLINPKRSIPAEAIKIHGITDSMVADKPTIYDVLPTLLSFVGDLTIVAHNAPFDMGFFKNSCKRYFKDEYFNFDNRVVDTVRLSRKMFPELPNHKLGTVAKHIGYRFNQQHRSMEDAMATSQIYIKHLESLEIKKQEKQEDFSVEELKLYEVIKEILVKNNRSLDYVKYRRNGKYFDIDVFYNFFRAKLNGKKYYIISDIPMEDLNFLCETFQLEECPKSENGKTRILLDNNYNINPLETLIIKSYDQAFDSMTYYRDNVKSAKRNIDEYLESY